MAIINVLADDAEVNETTPRSQPNVNASRRDDDWSLFCQAVNAAKRIGVVMSCDERFINAVIRRMDRLSHTNNWIKSQVRVAVAFLIMEDDAAQDGEDNRMDWR